MNFNSMDNIKIQHFNALQNTWISHNEPFIYHCNHYNIFLQYSIEVANKYFDVYELQRDSAQEVAFSYFNRIFSWKAVSLADRVELVKKVFSESGFGQIEISDFSPNGATIVSPNEHYSYAWLLKFGKRSKESVPVSVFACGFFAGAFDAIFNETAGTFYTEQLKCLTKGDESVEFEVLRRTQPIEIQPTPQLGFRSVNKVLSKPSHTAIDYSAIRDAVVGMNLKAESDGLIRAFGVLLTHHFANYFSLISYRFLEELEQNIGELGLEMAKDLLVEAGHVCAFHTFGGIMLSNEWNALVKPFIKSKEDWAYGIIGVVNAFGWGFYEITELIPNEKLVIRIDNGYESNFYLDSYSNKHTHISYLAQGGCAGIMNLLYNGDITLAPNLTVEYYEQVSKSELKFKAVQTKCRIAGDEYDEITVTR